MGYRAATTWWLLPVDPSNPMGTGQAALRGDICLVKKHIDAGAPVNAPLRVAGGPSGLFFFVCVGGGRVWWLGAPVDELLAK